MSDLITRLRNPPLGTDTSERNLMTAAADLIDAQAARIAALEFDVAALNAAYIDRGRLYDARIAVLVEALRTIGYKAGGPDLGECIAIARAALEGKP